MYHQLISKGYECVILAPTTMPKTAKEIKTDKRDARKIAKCLAYGTYSKVFVPSDEDNSIKEYIRMRDDAKATGHRNIWIGSESLISVTRY